MLYDNFTRWQVRDTTGKRKYLNDAERARFLAEAKRLPHAERALCLTLVFTGCRISEALELSAARLDREQQSLTFRTLKRRALSFRTVPIPEDLVRTLAALPAEQFWPMHRATAWRLVKRVMRAADINGPMACCKGHRHAFGMRAVERGLPPGLVQSLLGHASLSTTTIYMQAVGNEERAFVARMW